MRTLYVVSLSSGMSSAIAADRAIKAWGRDNVELVFMDTQIEDDDNYRFLEELEHHFDMPITWLSEGRTPYQVFEDEHIVPNSLVAPCTQRLKIELFVKHLKAYQENGIQPVVVLGMNWTEPHRLEAPRRNYGKLGIEVEYPCLWKPLDFNPHDTVKSWGIEPPRMYGYGYSHANCGGQCVKQGIGDWMRTMVFFPERFDQTAEWEEKQDNGYTLLKDRTGGETKPLPLSSLRQRQACKAPGQLTLWDDQTNCFCNAGDPGDLAEEKP